MGLHLSESRLHDTDREYTDEELGIAPPPPGFRWDILTWFGASALFVVFIALIVVLA
jgi:hypothetical protein